MVVDQPRPEKSRALGPWSARPGSEHHHVDRGHLARIVTDVLEIAIAELSRATRSPAAHRPLGHGTGVARTGGEPVDKAPTLATGVWGGYFPRPPQDHRGFRKEQTLTLPPARGDICPVFHAVATRLRAAIGRQVDRARQGLTEMFRPAGVVTGLVGDMCRTKDELLGENSVLRQQLILASRKVKQPMFRPLERGLMVALASMVRNWQSAVLLVKPDTLLRWHREGFRLLLKRKSQAARPRQLRISPETVELIRPMAKENKYWGAERIRGELLKLGRRRREHQAGDSRWRDARTQRGVDRRAACTAVSSFPRDQPTVEGVESRTPQ